MLHSFDSTYFVVLVLMLFSRLSYCLAIIALVLTLGITTSVSNEKQASIYKSQSFIEKVNDSTLDIGVLVTHNQASNFSHVEKVFTHYLFVAFIGLFTLPVLKIKWYKPTVAPPWFLTLKKNSRSSISAWKSSNILYKARLTYED